jgi:hypothetical protein
MTMSDEFSSEINVTSSAGINETNVSSSSEINMLREKLQRLEEELAALRNQARPCRDDTRKTNGSRKRDEVETDDASEEKEESKARHAARSVGDEIGRLTRGLVYAGLESMAVTADATRFFVDKVSERNKGEKRDTTGKQMSSLPWDMGSAFVDTLDEYASKNRKVVDRFYDEYRAE